MAHARRRHAYQAPSWLGLLIWTLIFTAIFWLAASAPAYPAIDRVDATQRPTCSTGKPLTLWLMNESSATDCDATAGGSTPALCCCDGDASPAWAACAAAGGSGTVTSVGLTMPAEFSVSGSPVTTSGTLAVTEATQTANTVYAGPTSGGAAAPGYRALVSADIPNNAANTSGNAGTATALAANGANCSAGSFPLGVDASGAAESCTAVVDRPRSIHNPPASPGTYDCEFTSGLCSGYAFSVDAGTAGPDSGTIAPVASLTGNPVYDTATWPGWVLVQSDESVGQGVYIKKTATVATDATLYGRVLSDNNNISAGGEGAVCLKIYNSGDSNENVSACVNKGTSATSIYCDVNNNGSLSSITSPGSFGEEIPVAWDTLVIWKSTNAYYCGAFGIGGAWSGVLPIGTKTGVTTFDQISVVAVTANETPSMVWGFDYLRLLDSVSFPPLNP